MPELPEVETIAWRLRQGGHGEPQLVGQKVVDVVVVDDKAFREGDPQACKGATVTDVTRRAKWLLIHFDQGDPWLVHMKMTGDLHVKDALPEKFVRFHWTLDSGQKLVFTDPRRMGHVDVVKDPEPFFSDLGPEPLSGDFSVDVLRTQLAGRRTPIKATLMDQSIVSGLGNIYADEALHRAGIDPRVPTNEVDDSKMEPLHAAIQDVLNEQIAEEKKELAWRYENRTAPSPFKVYERAGEPCLTCSTTLRETSIGGRTAVWCPKCQPSDLPLPDPPAEEKDEKKAKKKKK